MRLRKDVPRFHLLTKDGRRYLVARAMQGPPGAGSVAGGATGDVLRKQGPENYNYAWDPLTDLARQTALEAEIAAREADVDAEEAARVADVNAEETARIAADNVEIAARQQGDLDEAIARVAGIAAEAAIRNANDAAETNARIAADSAETTARTTADGVLQAQIDLKAPLDSPHFTSIPTAPTAPLGTNTTQLATMAAISAAINNLVGSAPGTLDTLNEIATALGNDPNFAATMTAQLAGKQPLDATLTALAALAVAADKLIYATGVDTFALADFPAAARTLLAATTQTAQRLALGLVIGTDVLPVNNPVFTGTITGPSVTLSSGGVSSIIRQYPGTDGWLQMLNPALTTFGMLTWGPNTSSFPGILRNGTTLEFKLADNSGPAGMASSTALHTGKVTIGLTALKNPQVDINLGGTGNSSSPDATTNLRLRANTTDGNANVLLFGGPSGNGNPTGAWFIQNYQWGGSGGAPVTLNPQGGLVTTGGSGSINLNAGSDFSTFGLSFIAFGGLVVKDKSASTTTANNGALGGRVGFHAPTSTYETSLSWIAGIFDQSSHERGEGIVFGVQGVSSFSSSLDFNSVVGTEAGRFSSTKNFILGAGFSAGNKRGTQKLHVYNGGMAFEGSLPAPVAGTAALAGLGAGNLSNGQYRYFWVFTTQNGETTRGAEFTVTVVNNAADGQVSITNHPTSTDPAVIARSLFRTIAGGGTSDANFYRHTTITDNFSTTPIVDNVSDATLTTTPATSQYQGIDRSYGGIWNGTTQVAQIVGGNWVEGRFGQAPIIAGGSGSGYPQVGYNFRLVQGANYYRSPDTASWVQFYDGGIKVWGTPTVGSTNGSLSAATTLFEVTKAGLTLLNAGTIALKATGTSLQVRNAADSADRDLTAGIITASSYIKSGSFTFATLPNATTSGAGARAYCTNLLTTGYRDVAAGGGTGKGTVTSDGTQWLVGA